MTNEQFYIQLSTDLQAIEGHAELSDAALATAINAKTISGTKYIPSISLLVWVATRGKLAGIAAAAANPAHPAQNIAIALMAIAQRPDAYFDKDDPDHMGMVDGLVTAGLFTSDDKTSLLAMTVTTTLYVPATYGVSTITEHDIAHARSIE